MFIREVTEAQSLRVQIGKYLQLCDRHVKELKDLDQVMKGEGEDNSDNEEEFSETRAKLVVELGKLKTGNAEHREVCFQIQKMSNFMLESDVNISEADSKNKQEARKILVSSENHEKETDTSVFHWKKKNAKRAQEKEKA